MKGTDALKPTKLAAARPANQHQNFQGNLAQRTIIRLQLLKLNSANAYYTKQQNN